MTRDHRAGRRAALFVDFDNIFIGLGGASSEAAVSFGTKPASWLRWLEREIAGDGTDQGSCRFLVRRCYLNPETFRAYRPYFIRAAFEVVDCPPLTSTGKTSADMSMALDIVDALHHSTHFDDFVVLSGDADFRPVLLRLRKHDRRTAILPIGPVSPAYRAAADLVLSQDDFVERSLALNGGRGRSGGDGASAPADLRAIAARIAEQVEATGQVPASDLPQIYMTFPAFSNGSDWLGFGTLRRMTEAVLAEARQLGVEEEGDAWRIVSRADHPTAIGGVARTGRARKSAATMRRPADAGSEAAAREAISDAEIDATARRISDLTDVPLLSSADYARIFAAIAQEIGENGYHLTQTARSTLDRLSEQGMRVGRSEIGLILKGLAHRYGERLGRRLRHEELAQGFADNVEQLCARAQLSLSAEEGARLRRWIGGR